MMGINTTQPVLAGDDGITEGMSNARVYYYEDSRILNLKATMRSSSGEFNDRVYFTINETNYDMDPYIYVEGNKNILQYNYYLTGLDYGIYEIKFFHENSTGTYEYEKNFTVNVTAFEFDVLDYTNYGYNSIGYHTNNLSFYAYWNNEELNEEIENVQLNIDGTSEAMNWDDCTKKYLFVKDFGVHNPNTYNYSISFSMGKENYQTENYSVTSVNYTEASNLWATIYPIYTPESLDFNIILTYITWQNVEPIIKLEIDGENQTIEPKFDVQNILQCEEITEIDWTNYQDLGMYSITGLEEGENHTINVYAFDGVKWHSYNLMDNETLAMPPVNEDFTIDILDWGIITPEDWYSTLTIDINVTCPYLTNAYERNQASISLYGPLTNRPLFKNMIEDDYSDADYSNGKIYNFSYTLWDTKEGFGELTGKFHIFYQNQTTTTTYGNYVSSNYTFSMSETPVAEFGINKDDWFVYESGYETTFEDCDYCNQKSYSYYLYKVVDFGYELGVNYLDLEKYNWDKCNENWVYDCPNYNNEVLNYFYNHNSLPSYVNNVSMRIWVNVNDNSSIDDWVFLPLNNISNYLEYYSREYFEDNVKTTSSSVEIKSKLGDAQFNEVIEVDKDGFLKEYSVTREYGKYYTYTSFTKLINYGNGDIPKDIRVKANIGVTISIIVVVLGISVAGVVVTYKSNKFPQFNSFLEKFKKN